jgi:hypothetical protein
MAFTSPNSVNVHRQNLGFSLHPRLSEVACGLVCHLQLPQHDYSQSVTHGSWTDEFEVSIARSGEISDVKTYSVSITTNLIAVKAMMPIIMHMESP